MERDLVRRCNECGIDFVWTVGEQATGPQPDRCSGCQKLAPSSSRQRGLVKWYSRGKGYGFITPAAGPDIFIHESGLGATADALRVGQLVEFGVSLGGRGYAGRAGGGVGDG